MSKEKRISKEMLEESEVIMELACKNCGNHIGYIKVNQIPNGFNGKPVNSIYSEMLGIGIQMLCDECIKTIAKMSGRGEEDECD